MTLGFSLPLFFHTTDTQKEQSFTVPPFPKQLDKARADLVAVALSLFEAVL
jgi:hypothetical protein